MKRWSTISAIGFGLLGLYLAVAHADLRPRFHLLTKSPVPANGVLRFAYEPEVTVRIVAADGTEVPGSFIESGVWRPTEEFAIGTYTADVSYEPNPSLADDGSFEVVSALTPSLAFLDIQVTSRVEAAEVLNEACCLEGAADVMGEPCTSDCEPLCVALSYAAKQHVEVYYAVDSGSPLAYQTIVRAPDTLDPGQYIEGYWPVEGSPEELCGVAEVFSWLDESTALATHCVANPKPDLDPIAETVSSFGYITECTLPPSGYEKEWCASQAYTCEVEAPSLDGASRAVVSDACSHYWDVCGRPPPANSGSEGLRDAAAPSTSRPDEVNTNSEIGTRASTRGCSCMIGSRPPMHIHLTGLGVFVLFAMRRRSAVGKAALPIGR